MAEPGARTYGRRVDTIAAPIDAAQGVRPLGECRRTDVAVVGGKGANLGELIGAGFRVPGGFAVTADAYLAALDAAGVRTRLAELTTEALTASPERLAEIASEGRHLVESTPIPDELASAVTAAYNGLGADVPVAVRSSATAEDTAETSFAGMNETYTNVIGAEALLDRVRACWRSLYGDRVVAYRAEQDLGDEPAISVVVQEMVDSDRAGVMFTTDPAHRGELLIEGAFGLGEVVVSGAVEPDTYRLDRELGAIREIRIGHKSVGIVKGADGAD